jgi:hypothetical protein
MKSASLPLQAGAPLLVSQEENEWPRQDHTNPFAQPERAGIVRVHQKSQDQPGAKVEPDRRTTAPDSRAHAVRRRHQPRRPPDAKIRAVNKVARRIVTKPSGEFGLRVNLERGFKCPIRSTLQIRCRRTALRARQSRIRANADYRKALDSHPSERTAAAARTSLLQHNSVNCFFWTTLHLARTVD